MCKYKKVWVDWPMSQSQPVSNHLVLAYLALMTWLMMRVSEWIIIIFIMTDGATAAGQYASLVIRNTLSPQIELLSMIIYRIAKFKSAKSAYCNTSATSKAQWWKFEVGDTSATSKASKAKWWKFELLAESLVWYPGKIIGCSGLACASQQLTSSTKDWL